MLLSLFPFWCLDPQEDPASGGEDDGTAFGSGDENEDGAGGILEPVVRSQRESDPVRLRVSPPPCARVRTCFLEDRQRERKTDQVERERERGGGETE